MQMNKTRVLFGKNVENPARMDVAIFHENDLVLSSGHATYLHKVLPSIPSGWTEVSRGNLVVSNELPYFNGNSLEPVCDPFIFQFFHLEKQEEVLYSLPQFRQEEGDEKKKNMRRILLLDDINHEMVSTCITNKFNASFFFGVGGRRFVTLDKSSKILKPLYALRSGSAILSPDFEVDDNQYLMAWREANDSEGVQQPTYFQIYKNVI